MTDSVGTDLPDRDGAPHGRPLAMGGRTLPVLVGALLLFGLEGLLDLSGGLSLGVDLAAGLVHPLSSGSLALISFLGAAAVLGRGARRSGQSTLSQDKSPDLARAASIVHGQDAATAGLVALGDKRLLFSPCGAAFVMYAERGGTLAVLFDPVGPLHLWPGLVMRLMRLARERRRRLAFYQVTPAFLPLAADAGLRAFKLGDQAVVDLPGFDIRGGGWLKLRRSINRAERDGLEFALLPAAATTAVIAELAAVSADWLSRRAGGEKGFSLGQFRPDYVSAHPVAVIRREGRIIAFATVLTTATRQEAFIDLMRHLPGVHRGLMDLLFVKLMLALKAEGYQRLNLGMAPLAGLSDRPGAPLWHQIGRLIHDHGERFYNFQGVEAFKAKFHPDWQPRYLVVARSRALVPALLDIALLIGGGLHGLLRRPASASRRPPATGEEERSATGARRGFPGLWRPFRPRVRRLRGRDPTSSDQEMEKRRPSRLWRL